MRRRRVSAAFAPLMLSTWVALQAVREPREEGGRLRVGPQDLGKIPRHVDVARTVGKAQRDTDRVVDETGGRCPAPSRFITSTGTPIPVLLPLATTVVSNVALGVWV